MAMRTFILTKLLDKRKHLFFILFGLVTCGLGSVWWASAQSDGEDQTLNPGSKATALWAFYHPIEYHQLLESLKSPEQREKDAEAWFSIYHPAEYAARRESKMSPEECQAHHRALQAMLNPKEEAREREMHMTLQDQADRQRSLEAVLTFQGASRQAPEPASATNLSTQPDAN